RVDVRVVAATHRDLAAMAAQGSFRHDLYYRLNVFPLHVPPLRARKCDLPALVAHMLATDATLTELGIRAVSPAAMKALEAHDWPGNVRELQSALIRAAVVAGGDTLTSQDLPDFAAAANGQTGPFPTLAEVEREHVKRALALAGGNQSRAAAMLGIHRNTLRKWLNP
ncbi:MAG: helix-turn-helix domain-containing protein, partial [Myxococcales bacterium]